MRYPWWDRWHSLRSRPLPQAKAEQAIEIAAQFIEEYASDVEADGWRPIHVLKPITGLAWRWPYLPLVSTRRGLMGATLKPFDFVYRAHRDGSFSAVTGLARHKALMQFGLPGEYS